MPHPGGDFARGRAPADLAFAIPLSYTLQRHTTLWRVLLMARKTVSGAMWAAASGQRALGLTLTPAEHHAFGMLAAALGVRGKAALARALSRWAITTSDGGKNPDKVRKILGKSLDSLE